MTSLPKLRYLGRAVAKKPHKYRTFGAFLEWRKGVDCMKATGIVRRVDDLGRIVIPKEIRTMLGIKEADPVEIFTGNDGEVILKKYSDLDEVGEIVKQYADSIAQVTGENVCITDCSRIVTAAGRLKKELLDKKNSDELNDVMNAREMLVASKGDNGFINVTSDGKEEFTSEAICPIISGSNVYGAVIMLSSDSKKKFARGEQDIVATAANYLGKHMWT